MPDFPPLIYCDLIEASPKTYEDWHRGSALARLKTDQEAAYRDYLDSFQPWRIAIKSGDNQKALFRSTENYFNKADAIHAAQLAFGTGSNVYLRQAEHGNILLRRALEA